MLTLKSAPLAACFIKASFRVLLGTHTQRVIRGKIKIVETEDPLKILAVCTGNVCRSPMAERLLVAGFESLAPGQVVVSSAGTGALVGSPMDLQVEGLVHVIGGRSEGFAARQLTETILEGVDIVLAMTRAHRSKVVELAPALVRRTFTLRELARILPSIDGRVGVSTRDRWLDGAQRAARARTHSGAPAADDIVDPFGRTPEIYQQMTRELVPAVESLIRWERDNSSPSREDHDHYRLGR